eukprot:scaffold151210_cov18-Tisochrysis_lutea.AAC.1
MPWSTTSYKAKVYRARSYDRLSTIVMQIYAARFVTSSSSSSSSSLQATVLILYPRATSLNNIVDQEASTVRLFLPITSQTKHK